VRRDEDGKGPWFAASWLLIGVEKSDPRVQAAYNLLSARLGSDIAPRLHRSRLCV